MPRKSERPDESTGELNSVWDKRADESGRAYHAFCAYRDAGPTRKMDAVYRRYESERGRVLPEHRRCASSWWKWYKDFDWRHRAEAYDMHCDFAARKIRESEHSEKIHEHLERQRKIARACQNVCLRMLQIAQDELSKVVAPHETPGAHALDPKKLAMWVRSAVGLASMSAEHEANALGIDDLLSIINETQSGG